MASCYVCLKSFVESADLLGTTKMKLCVEHRSKESIKSAPQTFAPAVHSLDTPFTGKISCAEVVHSNGRVCLSKDGKQVSWRTINGVTCADCVKRWWKDHKDKRAVTDKEAPDFFYDAQGYRISRKDLEKRLVDEDTTCPF